MDNEIEVKTRANKDLIEQEVIWPHGNLMHQKMVEVIKLKDAGIRDALIKLGWTPPKEEMTDD